MHINWTLKSFTELSLEELYTVLRLRNEVFIVEQNCPYQDLDLKDQQSYHLLGRDANDLVAYTRLLPAGLSFNEVSIGRVLTSPAYRRHGAGKLLMEKSISTIRELFGNVPVRIGAQLYLEKFYTGFGFVKDSDIYLEDGIKHIEMLLE